MKKRTIILALVTMILGTLLHFIYEWSGENPIVALFSAINESTWEHMKLFFFPYLFCAILQYYLQDKSPSNFITAKAVGAVIGLFTIPVLFYGYTAILGYNIAFLDISIFVISVVLAYFTDYIIQKKDSMCFNKVSLGILILITLAFWIITLWQLS